MGGASYKLGISVCGSACTAAALTLKARSGTLTVACKERKKMAAAPEEEATAELKQLTPEDEDYNPFSDEGIDLQRSFILKYFSIDRNCTIHS